MAAYVKGYLKILKKHIYKAITHSFLSPYEMQMEMYHCKDRVTPRVCHPETATLSNNCEFDWLSASF